MTATKLFNQLSKMLIKIIINMIYEQINCTDLFAATWDEANKVCTDLSSTLISEDIETTEKRK